VLHVEKIAAFAGLDLARWRSHPAVAEPAVRERMGRPNARLRKQLLKTGYTQVYVDAVNMVFRAQRP
jgi:hypothetical protein